MADASAATPCVLVTGATGFLGKVVVEELLRRALPTASAPIVVMVRSKRGRAAAARFAEMLASPCFAALPPGWQQRLSCVEGNLSAPGCGLSAADAARLAGSVTHVVHCAASVDFDLPLKQAADANIHASLNMLQVAASCRHLQRMVSVSTAYVTPHQRGAVDERLAPLPQEAGRLLDEIEAGHTGKEAMLGRTGHPNTYTLTKSIAEHLLCAQRGKVPLHIVRPSIIAAAWQHPVPGWIDSHAALAGFVASIGAGVMRVIDADPAVRLDVVPVDVVAGRIIDEAFAPAAAGDASDALGAVPIRYAVAGLAQAARIDAWVAAIEAQFVRTPLQRRARVHHVGAADWRYRMQRLRHQVLPAAAAQAAFRVAGRADLQRRARRVVQKVDAINRVFPYFTHKAFDFRASVPLPADFSLPQYLAVCCAGVAQHLMGQNPRAVRLGGAKQPPRRSELLWALGRPRGNWAIRLSAATLAKSLARMCDEVTFDQASFEAAQAGVAAAGPGAGVVLVPTHRSYMDFLLCSYLVFARPELRLRIPYIAAAQEFSHIQLVGWLFTQMHAFYLRRNTGKEDPELTEQVHALVDRGEALQFFIEGQRSRSRQFLPPRRGLLRCLQKTGRPFVILPVSICYDRVPEEATFRRELQGYPKDRMQLRGLLRWSARMLRGEVSLGRLHVRCGAPLPLRADSDVPRLSHAIMAELQRNMATSVYHLQCFVEAHPGLDIDVPWLRAAIEARGGRIIDSELTPPVAGDPIIERSLRHQWAHLFLPEACQAQPDNPALAHHREENAWVEVAPPAPAASAADRGRLAALLGVLFEPVCRDYQAVARGLAQRRDGRRATLPRDQIVRHAGAADHTTACAAVRALTAAGLLGRVDREHLTQRGTARELQAFVGRSAWRPGAVRGALRLVTG